MPSPPVAGWTRQRRDAVRSAAANRGDGPPNRMGCGGPIRRPAAEGDMHDWHTTHPNPDPGRRLRRRLHGPDAREAPQGRARARRGRAGAGEPRQLHRLPADAARGDLGEHRDPGHHHADPPALPAHEPLHADDREHRPQAQARGRGGRLRLAAALPRVRPPRDRARQRHELRRPARPRRARAAVQVSRRRARAAQSRHPRPGGGRHRARPRDAQEPPDLRRGRRRLLRSGGGRRAERLRAGGGEELQERPARGDPGGVAPRGRR